MKIKSYKLAKQIHKLPLVLILAGILFTLYLQFQLKDEIFFSGDGSLKFLLAKQFSSGNFRFDLDLPAENWVQNLWKDGLYPFGREEPFIYYRFNRYYSPFPFTFSLITAPLYALFGFKGLNIIPLVALWIIWFSFYFLCQRLNLGIGITVLGLTTLIFSSPLTLYGAIYWEHTLAVALAFHGLATLLAPRSGELSKKEAILSGILIGLSVWFRGEFLCLIGIICLLVFASSKLNFVFELALLLSALIFGVFVLSKEGYLWFVGIGCLLVYAASKIKFVVNNKKILLGSMLLTLAIYWGINLIIYHHPLGIHALQVVENLSLRVRFKDAFKYFQELNSNLFYHFPILFFPVIYAVVSLFNKRMSLTTNMKVLLVVYLLFTFSVPILLPSDGGKQWGPRFLLIIIPLISLLAVLVLQRAIRVTQFGSRYIISAIFVGLLTVGIYINTYTGSAYLIKSYKPSSTLNFLRTSSDKIIVGTHEFVNQSLVSIFNEKIFFLTKENEDLVSLGKALHKQGYQDFIYICYPYHPCHSSQKEPEILEFNVEGKTLKMEFYKLGNFNKNILYKSLITESKTTLEL